ncbi:MAG: acetylglutamate kinase [Acidobacteria bacterium]|nr:MAG: acetylglutamate kinase [Acidobacteriota bacterium]
MRTHRGLAAMSVVVKVGGALLENPARAVEEIQQVATTKTVVVHGGGLQITRMLERMKVASVFIDGLRVTDRQTLAAVAVALIGEVHTALVAQLRQNGLAAVGMFGLIRASQKPGPWGLVGNNVRADPVALNAILEAGRLPVIPALALGETSLLNVNGDETAAAVAVALESSELVFLTDVEGVKDADGMVLDRAAAPDELLAASFVSGGMIPKLRAVKAAMDGGVRMVRVGRTRFGRIS